MKVARFEQEFNKINICPSRFRANSFSTAGILYAAAGPDMKSAAGEGNVHAVLRCAALLTQAERLCQNGKIFSKCRFVKHHVQRRKRAVAGETARQEDARGEREEAADSVEAFLVLAVTSFYLAVVARSVGADQLVTNAKFCRGCLEQSRNVPLAAGEAVCELEAVVRLYTFDLHAFAGK